MGLRVGTGQGMRDMKDMDVNRIGKRSSQGMQKEERYRCKLYG